jgi:hypothetical protein
MGNWVIAVAPGLVAEPGTPSSKCVWQTLRSRFSRIPTGGGIAGVIEPGWVNIESSLSLAAALGDEGSPKQLAGRSQDEIPMGERKRGGSQFQDKHFKLRGPIEPQLSLKVVSKPDLNLSQTLTQLLFCSRQRRSAFPALQGPLTMHLIGGNGSFVKNDPNGINGCIRIIKGRPFWSRL